MGGPVMSWAAGPAVVLGSFVVGWGVARLGVAIASTRLRRAGGMPWVEVARRAYPARRVVGIDSAVVPLAAASIVFFRVAPALGLAPRVWGVLASMAGLFGVLAAGRGLEFRLARMARPEGGRPAGVTLATLLLPGTLGPFALMLALMPDRWGWGAAGALASGSALATFHTAGGWLVPLRWLGLARPASPRLREVVERAAGRVGVRPRATVELASPQVNALAWPIPRLLTFTGPILEALDDDELASITAHELGHLDEPWGAYLSRLLGSYFTVGCAAALPLIGSYGVAVGLAPFVAMVGLIFVVRRVGRRMEERSDRIGREHEGESAGTYARALAAIYRANLVPAVLPGRRNVHPHLYDRLLAAGVAVDYPRPDPPPRVGLASLPGLLLAMAGGVALGSGLNSGPREAAILDNRAQAMLDRGEVEATVPLFREAAGLDPATTNHPANLASVLASLGRLDEAEAAVRQAEEARRRGGRDFSEFLAKVRAEIRRRRVEAGPPPGLNAPRP